MSARNSILRVLSKDIAELTVNEDMFDQETQVCARFVILTLGLY